MKTIHDRDKIIEKIEGDELKSRDYGCEGSDECCGNCGGNYLSEHLLVDYILKLIEEVRLKTIDEAIEIVRKENYLLEEWYASAERPTNISHFDASQRNIKSRNQTITNLKQLKK